MRQSACRTSSRSGCCMPRQRRPALAFVMTAAIGWLISCAIEAVISPSSITRLTRARSAWACCKASSARLRSVMSTATTPRKAGVLVRRTNDKCIDVGPNDLAVLATVTLFNPIATLRTSDDLVNMLSQPFPIVLVSNILRGQVSQLLLGIAGHQLETLIRCHVSSVFGTEGYNADRRCFDHSSPALFARSQRFHGALALRNEKGRQAD